MSNEITLAVNGGVFARMVGNVAMCAETNSALPSLCVVNIELTPGNVRLVATDRYVCGLVDIPNSDISVQREVPVNAKELVKTLKSVGDRDLDVTIGEERVTFTWREGSVSLPIEPYKFPAYRDVLESLNYGEPSEESERLFEPKYLKLLGSIKLGKPRLSTMLPKVKLTYHAQSGKPVLARVFHEESDIESYTIYLMPKRS